MMVSPSYFVRQAFSKVNNFQLKEHSFCGLQFKCVVLVK